MDLAAVFMAFVMTLKFFRFGFDIAGEASVLFSVRMTLVMSCATMSVLHRSAASLMVLSTILVKLRGMMTLSLFFEFFHVSL